MNTVGVRRFMGILKQVWLLRILSNPCLKMFHDDFFEGYGNISDTSTLEGKILIMDKLFPISLARNTYLAITVLVLESSLLVYRTYKVYPSNNDLVSVRTYKVSSSNKDLVLVCIRSSGPSPADLCYDGCSLVVPEASTAC